MLTHKIDDDDTQVFIYDELYRVTEADYNDGNTTSYSYDSRGNRTDVNDGTSASYVRNSINQYTSVGGTSFSYDDNGNLTDDGTYIGGTPIKIPAALPAGEYDMLIYDNGKPVIADVVQVGKRIGVINNIAEGIGAGFYDCDGDISKLVGHWLDAGVNVLFPIEIGTWKADPMEYRKKYGKELRLVGGLNKLELEKGPAAIDAEIDRRIPLMKDGGYVVMPDHLITPGTSLENYKYYLQKIRTLRL